MSSEREELGMRASYDIPKDLTQGFAAGGGAEVVKEAEAWPMVERLATILEGGEEEHFSWGELLAAGAELRSLLAALGEAQQERDAAEREVVNQVAEKAVLRRSMGDSDKDAAEWRHRAGTYEVRLTEAERRLDALRNPPESAGVTISGEAVGIIQRLRAELSEAERVLQEIVDGKVQFSMDPLEHARWAAETFQGKARAYFAARRERAGKESE